MRNSSEVVLSCTVLTLLALGLIALRISKKNQQGMLIAIKSGLERTYDEGIAAASKIENQTSLHLQPEVMRHFILSNMAQQVAVFPSFVTPEEIYLSVKPVRASEEAMLCVVQITDSGFYGIDGRRQFRQLNKREFDAWPHQKLTGTNSSRRKSVV